MVEEKRLEIGKVANMIFPTIISLRDRRKQCRNVTLDWLGLLPIILPGYWDLD